MNDTTTTIFARLQQAEQDAARWRQLSGAPDLAAALRREYERATAAQAKADAAAEKEAAATRFAGLSNISVVSRQDKFGGGVLRSNFTITWTGREWNMYENVPRQFTATSFDSLPALVYAFLVEKHPEQIPAEIMALAPGDPHGAMERFFMGKRRGYLTGPVAA